MSKGLHKSMVLFITILMAVFILSGVSVLAQDSTEKYITIDRVNLRSGPFLDSEILLTVDVGTYIKVEAVEGKWYKVLYKEKQGYMNSEFVGSVEAQPEPPVIIEEQNNYPVIEESAEPVAIQDGYVTLDRVNLRLEPSLDATIFTTVNPGSNIKVEFFDNEWYKVIYNDASGYMKAEYVGKPEELKRSDRAELTPWSEAKAIFSTGVPAEVYDVRTGRVYYVKSFSNGSHADVEPITPDDTYSLLGTFGGVWSWDTRPILVTINGHTMAASISGMPHGGGVNNSNNMNGQVCIHFLGSRTHNGNTTHEKEHQACVMEAYNKSGINSI